MLLLMKKPSMLCERVAGNDWVTIPWLANYSKKELISLNSLNRLSFSIDDK